MIVELPHRHVPAEAGLPSTTASRPQPGNTAVLSLSVPSISITRRPPLSAQSEASMPSTGYTIASPLSHLARRDPAYAIATRTSLSDGQVSPRHWRIDVVSAPPVLGAHSPPHPRALASTGQPR